MSEVITFKASLARITTDGDGESKVTFAIPLIHLTEATKLAHTSGMLLSVEILPE